MKNLYKILEIDKNASQKDISKAYKKLAFKHHPDKGGSEDKFKEISEAYSVLSDSNKKKIYDLGGYDAVNSGFSSSSPFDMFSNIFEGGFSTSTIFESDFFKNQDDTKKIYNLDVTIQELYNGCKKSVEIKSKDICKKCNGYGCKQDGKETCSKCNGSKYIKSSKSFGPFVQTVNVPCDMCNENGYTIKKGYECKSCNNTGYIDIIDKYNLNISKGSIQKEIFLEGKGDYCDTLNKRNDLIIKINELPNDRFVHKNRDIYIEEDIHLWDSILGSDHIIEYINTDLIINIDKIIDPNIMMIVKGYGMPEFGEHKKGDLIIKFNIIYPDSIPNISKIKELVNHPIYDNNGINIDYYNHVNTFKNDDSDDNDTMPPQCVQQ